MMIQPSFPEFMPASDWQPPDSFPDLSRAKWISLDVESRDPYLRSRGPGYLRHDAYVCGVAIHTEGFSGYYAVRHAQGDNFAPNVVFSWLSDVAKEFSGEMYGGNLLYDLEALYFEDVHFQDSVKFSDVQIAEPCIDEESVKGYSVEELSNKYLGVGKDESLLRDAACMFTKGYKDKRAKRPIHFDPKADLWMLDPKYVGAYAEGDVDRPRRIFQEQVKILDKENLWQIFNLERSLVPILLKMRIEGVRVDLKKAGALVKLLSSEIDKYSAKIKSLVGFEPNVDSGPDLEKAYNALNFKYPELNIVSKLKRTNLGNPSFTSEWYSTQDDPLSKAIHKKKKLMTLRDDFVQGDILGEHVDGRLHPQFHQLRDNDKGTRSGRMSSTHPNGQQVPARHDDDLWGVGSPNWAELVRGLFVANVGEIFSKNDFSQQEPRLLVHFAGKSNLPGADVAVKAFRDNPRQDYHQFTTDLVNKISGKNFKRKRIKGVNLGLAYAMGLFKLARQLGVPMDEAKEILNDYHRALPFVRALSSKCQQVAQERGYIVTLLGRHQRFNLFEPVPDNKEEREYFKGRGLPLEQAQSAWPGRRLQRAGIHKSVNRLVQGSAADQTKEAMRQLYYDHGRLTMSLPVHDELSGSVVDRHQAMVVKQVMENCVQLIVPVVCDSTVGQSWGEAKEEVLLEGAV
jgi:DNA polymerase-1